MDAKKGTTSVVLVYKNGVVFATDKQASFGLSITFKTTCKIFQVNDNIAVTIAGSLGDAQYLVDLLKAESALRKTESLVRVPVVASLASRIFHGNRFYPLLYGSQ
jgi:proteasome beta subunit